MIKIEDFDYQLPRSLIAQRALKKRDNCRLLCVNKELVIKHKHFYDLVKMLGPNDVLVLNRSKVFKARLLGYKDSGGQVEVLLLKKIENNRWKALGKNVKEGQRIKFLRGFGKVVKKVGSEIEIELSFGEKMIDKIGRTPLPPYIKSKRDWTDEYQTVYAREVGSSAAPTAGLHFTKKLLEKLKAKGVIIEEVVLHVGLGTFSSVTEENLKNRRLHEEEIEVDKNTWQRLITYKKLGKRVIAVGTTSLRVLESGMVKKTSMFIYPPYKFKMVDSLITNFHLPKTSLLMLVAAMVGQKNWKKIYREAIDKKYRFYSFGDAMWIDNS